MKPLFTLLAAVIFSLSFYFTVPLHSQPSKDKFYLGTFNLAEWPSLRDGNSTSNYTALSLNLMQGYGLHYDADPTNNDGGFRDPLTSYSSNINSMLSWWSGNFSGNTIIFEREKVLRPAYGKRSDYQAEYTPSQITGGSIRPAYGFAASNGNTYTETWQGETVSGRNTGLPESQSPYYLVKDLYENREQIYTPQRGDISNQHDLVYYLSCRKEPGYHYYIKPRMRIDSVFAKNPANFNTPVVAVITKNYSGRTIDSTILTCINFLDVNLNYNGRYLEQYYGLPPNNLVVLADSLMGDQPSGSRITNAQLTVNAVDYRVYWFGQVDVWLDYVRVDDEWAHFLFNPDTTHKYDFVTKIDTEAVFLNNKSGFGYFYMDEFHYCSLPCIAEVNRILQTVNSGFSIVPLVNDNYYVSGGALRNAPNFSDGYNYFVNSGAVQDILMTDIYPISDIYYLPPNVTMPDKTTFPGTRRYLKASGSQAYNDSLHWHLENGDWVYNSTIYEPSFLNRYRKCAGVVKSRQGSARPVVFSLAVQAHSFESLLKCDTVQIDSREPTNEEISLQCYLGLIYGAKQIMHYIYPSYRTSASCSGSGSPYLYDWGLLNYDNLNGVVRDTNYYGQKKWNFITHIDSTLKKIGSIMYPGGAGSFTYDTSRTVNRDGLPFKYISNLKSYYKNPSDHSLNYSDINADNIKYWEIGFFNSSSSTDKYFMLLNKRCVPETAVLGDGDLRTIRLFFDASQLTSYTNWKLIDALTGESVTFDKNNSSGVVCPFVFQPGEGKLFKLTPVAKSGGILVTNDTLSGVNITCEDTIFTNGYNLVITGNSTLSMSDSTAIIMNGGSLTIGSASSGPTSSKNTFQNTGSGHKWRGIQCIGANVKIYNAKFQDVKSSTSSYSLSCINCPLVDARYNTFILSDTSNGGINIGYTGTTGFVPPAAYINYNTFTMNDSRYNAIQVQGFAGLTSGLYAENNTMTSNGNATGVFLSTITGCVIKSNSMTGFSNGINMLFSTADIYGNTIFNTGSTSKGILASSHSSMNLAPNGTEWTGGLNSITNTYGNSHNLDLTNSVFTINGGDNTFNVSSTGSPEHLYGSLWNGAYTTKQRNNCYKLSGTAITSPTLPNNLVTDSSGNGITFTLSPYSCGVTPPTSTDIVDIGNGLYDTIPSGSGGMGGGVGMSGELLPLTKGELEGVFKTTPPFGHPSLSRRGMVVSINSISDSINIQMRHKNYNVVKNLCHALIDNYPDSMESIASLQTLYMASSLTDTSTAGKTALKTYYENLILNHGDNPVIVDISNYLIQKCKVLLRQYSSAMAGFTQIINNNQYNYEGLLARWDYMAASLLMNGGGGGENSIKNYELGITNLNSDEQLNTLNALDELNSLGDDKNPFSKEQKKSIIHSIFTATKTKRESEEAKITELKTKSEEGDDNAKIELNKKMALKNTVKTEKPKNIFEHLRIVSSDIQKVFGKPDVKTNSITNSVPIVFMLHQNYPNPFNPSATIKYDLPKDVKVQIKIYDILGREVKTLVNEFKKAGFYQAVFDGTNLASGVYFYKIEAHPAGSLTGDFIDSKKMVLIK